MPRTPHDVTDAELDVLQVLWNQGACSRRQIAEALYQEVGPTQYATVQKLLERLEAKGCVTRGTASPLTFQAALDREALINRRLLDVADRLCGGSVTPLVMNLVKAKALSTREVQELQQFLSELRQPERGRKPRA